MKNEKNYTPFYLAFLSLCERDNINPTSAAKRAGISSGAPTAWKNGAVPKPAQREKLCALFGVTDKELLGYEQEKKPAQEGELDAETKELRDIWDASDPDERQALLEMARLIKKRRNK